MNIHLDSPARLVLELSFSDLAELGLTYRTITYTSPTTRQALQRLLQDAAAQTGFDAKDGKLLIEVFPAADMGCTIRFTRFTGKRLRRTNDGVRIYEFTDSETMMDAMVQLYTAGTFGGSLYVSGEKYRLLIPCKAPSATDDLLCEYAKPLGKDKGKAAFTKEHYQKLCNDPSRTIGGAIVRQGL